MRGPGRFRLVSASNHYLGKGTIMADFKPGVRPNSRGSLILAGCAIWAANIFSAGPVGGQPPQGQPKPPSVPAPPPETKAIPVAVPTAFFTPPRGGFNFVIKPDTPLGELLPTPPQAAGRVGPLFIEDLAQVPEVVFQEPLAKTPEALKRTAHTMAKINHLNRRKVDGFMEALLGQRPDLAGLPVAMGDACRMKGDRTQFFTQALNTIKRAKGQGNVAFSSTARERVLIEQHVIADKLMKQEVVLRKALEDGKGQVVVAAPPQPTPQPTPPGPTSPVPVSGPQVQAFENATVAFIETKIVPQTKVDPDAFWDQFAKLCAQEDKANTKLDPAQLDHVTMARIAALMQVLGPESVAVRKGLVKYLAGTSHAEATRALAKLALFAPEAEVRDPAVEALKVRREKDYTQVLLAGLRYPLPAVAKRATEAMVKLERADLVGELVNFLEEPDPRAPAVKVVNDKKVPVVRELVRINHHRNCLMCHAPAIPNEIPPQVTTAQVPTPDQPLPSPSEGYDNSIPDVLVRLDVTYLRQDFSVMQPVADAHPWPEMQRFDFLVRNRVLTAEEEAAVPRPKAGTLSPYQRVTLAALRELTGRDTAPTPGAWRKLLELPAREGKTAAQ
jgi:hypothetical protein